MAGLTLEAEERLSQVGFHDVQAAAQALDGFVVRQDFLPTIRQYLRRKLIFWPLLRKEQAEANIVQELREDAHPAAGFFDKGDINPAETDTDHPMADFTDPGQEIKAGGGLIKISHYARSLYAQQGRPYGDLVSKKTSDLITNTGKTIERALFAGNASTNPLSFNGLNAQMAEGHAYTADKTGGHLVYKKLRSLARIALSDVDIMREVTHVFTSHLGLELLEDEMDSRLHYMNLDSIRPGLQVPGIIIQGDSQGGPTPIITSPYLQDQDNGPSNDVIHYWLVDMNTLCWKGVYPEGGERTLEPQIFEVSSFTSAATPYLVEKRMCLFYGTLWAANKGEGIWRLDVSVPSGTISSI